MVPFVHVAGCRISVRFNLPALAHSLAMSEVVIISQEKTMLGSLPLAEILSMPKFTILFSREADKDLQRLTKALGVRSTETLAYLLLGIGLIIAAEWALRRVRARALAYLGARVETLLSISAFQQVLHLPTVITESAPIGAQITRMRQFESVREIFTGPIATVVLDLPFVLFFVAMIFVIGGPLGWIAPLWMLGLVCLRLRRTGRRTTGSIENGR